MRVAIARVYAVSEIVFVNLPRRFDETLFSIEGDDLHRAELLSTSWAVSQECAVARPLNRDFPTA